MFKLEKTTFGRFEKFVISDENGRSGMAVSPDGCACLLELTLGGRPLLDAYQTPEELAHNAWYKNVPLFPFPNRLRDGIYDWGGKTLSFPVNDGAGGNALHGHSREFSTVPERVDLRATGAALSCRYQDAGDNPAYPFLFTFEITYRLQGPDRFEAAFRFQNDDKCDIPGGLGWHPYFRVTDRIDNLLLQLPACEMIGIDQRMLPTGKRYAYDEFATPKKIGPAVLDNCFALPPREGRAEVIMSTPEGRLRFWQETGPGKFNFLQLFTHPERSSLAVEPMSCNVDAFNNLDGLIVLRPGEAAVMSFGVIWENT